MEFDYAFDKTKEVTWVDWLEHILLFTWGQAAWEIKLIFIILMYQYISELLLIVTATTLWESLIFLFLDKTEMRIGGLCLYSY